MYEFGKERVAKYGNDKSKTRKFVNEITKRKRKTRQYAGWPPENLKIRGKT